MSDKPISMVCWPEKWIEAAVKAGFATYGFNGSCVFLNDKMRKMLQQFACEITGAECSMIRAPQHGDLNV